MPSLLKRRLSAWQTVGVVAVACALVVLYAAGIVSAVCLIGAVLASAIFVLWGTV